MADNIKYCFCGKVAIFRCIKCKKTYYCGTMCQALDWATHKKTHNTNKPPPPPPTSLDEIVRPIIKKTSTGIDIEFKKVTIGKQYKEVRYGKIPNSNYVYATCRFSGVIKERLRFSSLPIYVLNVRNRKDGETIYNVLYTVSCVDDLKYTTYELVHTIDACRKKKTTYQHILDQKEISTDKKSILDTLERICISYAVTELNVKAKDGFIPEKNTGYISYSAK